MSKSAIKEVLIESELVIKEIIEQLDSNIHTFIMEELESNPHLRELGEDTLRLWISGALEYFFHKDLTRSDSVNLYESMIRNRNKVKRRMAKKFEYDLLDYGVESSNSPLKEIAKICMKIGREEYEKEYSVNITETIHQAIKEMHIWAECSTSYYSDCKYRSSYTPKKRREMLENDIYVATYRYIADRYFKNVEDFVRSYILEMKNGYFSSSRSYFNIEDYNNNYSVTIPLSPSIDEENRLLLTINKDYFARIDNGRVTSLDAKDQDILCLLVKKCCSQERGKDFTVSMNELASSIASIPSKPSKRDYVDAVKRVYKLVNYTYNHYVGDKQVGAINFVQHAYLDGKPDEAKNMIVRMGAIIEDAVRLNKVKYLPAPAYNIITDNTAKLLYLFLQQQRIERHMQVIRGLAENYRVKFSYNDFAKVIYFGEYKGKMDINYNFSRIMDALNHYVDKGVILLKAIRDPKKKSTTVEVEFFPLIKEEEDDIRRFGWENN